MKSIIQLSILSMFMLLSVSCKKDTKATSPAGEMAPVAEATGTQYSVVPARSLVTWAGSKLAGTHTGTFQISEGSISVDKDKISGGKFIIDMNSLTNTDLAAGSGKEDLEGHLKSADFFDVANHPTASFEITKVTELEGAKDANSLVYGNLTLKGVTKQLGFKAHINYRGTGVSVTTPEFSFNRTDFGIKYGSSNFMDVMKDKAINDEVSLSISLGAM